MKRFVQGPNLHEESVARNTAPATHIKQLSLSGDEVKKFYEDIISTPSSGNWEITNSDNNKSIITVPSSPALRRKSSRSSSLTSSTAHHPPAPPKKSLNQLMALCESNQHSYLEAYINSQQSTQSTKFDINEQDIYGWSLLMSAACAGADDCVRFLLRNGASLSLNDKKGLTAVDLAKKNKRSETVSILNEWKQVYGNGSVILIDIDEDDDNDACLESRPIFCEACNQAFTNQKTHLKSIAHLLSSGELHNTEGKVHYGIPESNRGFQLMLKTGWDKSSGLGPDGQGKKFPIKTVLKRDRQGVGNERDKKLARITHFAPFDLTAVEGQKRAERVATVERKEQFKRKSKETRKEIKYRRQLSSL